MRVVYKKLITHKIEEAILKAKASKEVIVHIELTSEEMVEFRDAVEKYIPCCYHYCKGDGSYFGVKIKEIK